MARLLAIDYGLKRTGIAVTDPEQVIASPLDVIESHTLVRYLESYLEKQEVEGFVLGLPLNWDNSDTDITATVRKTANLLQKKFPAVKLFLHDERFTTSMAMDSMIRGGVSRKDRRSKKIIDKVSASLILQSFLEQKSNRRS